MGYMREGSRWLLVAAVVFLHLPTLSCLCLPSCLLFRIWLYVYCHHLSLNLRAPDPDGLANHLQLKLPKLETFAFPHHGLGRAKVAYQANKVRIITKSPRSLYESRGNTIGTAYSMAFTKWYQGVLDGSIRAKIGTILPRALVPPNRQSNIIPHVALWPWSSKARNHHLLN